MILLLSKCLNKYFFPFFKLMQINIAPKNEFILLNLSLLG